MRGKLVKQLRKATGFHPADERHYRMTNIVHRIGLKAGIPVQVDTGSFVAVGRRSGYQDLKAQVKVLKKNDEWQGFSHA